MFGLEFSLLIEICLVQASSSTLTQQSSFRHRFFGFTMHRGPTRLSDRGACSMSRADSESHTARPGREHHGMSLHTIGPSAAGTRHRSKDVHISSRTANATMIAPSTTCDTCQLERAAGTSDPPRCSKSAGLCAVHRASPLIPRACCADLDSRDGWLLRREPIAAGCSRHLSHPHPTAGHIG